MHYESLASELVTEFRRLVDEGKLYNRIIFYGSPCYALPLAEACAFLLSPLRVPVEVDSVGTIGNPYPFPAGYHVDADYFLNPDGRFKRNGEV